MILEESDFLTRPYKIGNQKESPDLEDFIVESERGLLISLLGYELYSLLKDAVEGSGELESRFSSLINGAEYNYNDKLYEYRGLKDLLRPAVYSMYVEENSYKFTNIGMVQNNAPQQSTLIESLEFVVRAWNDYCAKAGSYYRYSCLSDSQENSFYGFMKANESYYPEWHYKRPEPRNRFQL